MIGVRGDRCLKALSQTSEANQASDREFPAEYRDLIAKYYERLANVYTESQGN